MKFSKNSIPFLLALLPQILFEHYMLMLIVTIAIGFLGSWMIDEKRVFLKILLLQFIFFGILFLFQRPNIFYLDQVVGNLDLPGIIVPVLFIVVNTLNVAILFFFGYKLNKLIFSNAYLKT